MNKKIAVENREELVYLLSQAAELEHGLLCSYLFASFSLKNDVKEDLTSEEAAATTRWKRSIRKIAEQEMLHLTLANNLLSAVGAAPHFSRPNLPQSSDFYPSDIQLALTPFSEQTIDHFIFIERPQNVKLKDGVGFTAPAPKPKPNGSPVEGARASVVKEENDDETKDPIVPVEQEFSTVDELYRGIKLGLHHLVEKYGEDNIFIGPDGAQTSTKYFEFPGLVTVKDLASAEKAIELIVSQGEGSTGDLEESHFGIFSSIKEEYKALKALRPDFEPTRPVLANPYSRPSRDAIKVNMIDEPTTIMVSNLFNASYEVMTQLLIRFFAHTEETREELTLLVKAAVDMMKYVIKPLGELLTVLPAGLAFPQNTSGPNFQFYRSIHLLPHKKAAWLIFHERLLEIANYCEELKKSELYEQDIVKIESSLRDLASNLMS